MKRFFFVIILLGLLSCNLDVNTTDIQASTSLEKSMNDKFFICKYVVTDAAPDSIFTINDVWAEHAWKYVNDGGKVFKEDAGFTQIILALSGQNSSVYSKDKYLQDWKMEIPDIGILGRNNGMYVLALKSNDLPKKLDIVMHRQNTNEIHTVRLKLH